MDVGRTCVAHTEELLVVEKAVVVVLDLRAVVKDRAKAAADALEELNQCLAEGWRVKQSSSMAGADHYYSSCLVVLERDDG